MNLFLLKNIKYDKKFFFIFYLKDGSDVRLRHPYCVYMTAQRQYTKVQRCVHLWNNFPCIITLYIDLIVMNCFNDIGSRWLEFEPSNHFFSQLFSMFRDSHIKFYINILIRFIVGFFYIYTWMMARSLFMLIGRVGYSGRVGTMLIGRVGYSCRVGSMLIGRVGYSGRVKTILW